MTYKVPTNYHELILLIRVKTDSPQKIHIIVKDAEQINTVYTDRWKTVNGEIPFFVRMPITGKNAFAIIYNEKNGVMQNGEDKSFQVLEVKKLPMEKKMDVIDFNEPKVKAFINFYGRFCFNAGWLPSDTYVSKTQGFEIIYVPTIISNKTKQELSTPARISKTTGKIQASQKKYVPMTVPMRFAIGCHEFSHFYVNEHMEDESEADLNGLLIYLGLGFPRIEAYEAFLKTFIDSPSPANKIRYDKIRKFIDDFEKNNILMYE